MQSGTIVNYAECRFALRIAEKNLFQTFHSTKSCFSTQARSVANKQGCYSQNFFLQTSDNHCSGRTIEEYWYLVTVINFILPLNSNTECEFEFTKNLRRMKTYLPFIKLVKSEY